MKTFFNWMCLLLIIVILLISASSCNIERFFSRQRSDSTVVAKTQTEKRDSTAAGAVTTTNTKSKEDYEWWRVIMENLPKGDTTVTVNNIYPAPARVIYEGGTGKVETETYSKDSMWFYQLALLIKSSSDSTNRRIDNIEKQSKTETKGLGLFTLILVMGGAIVVFKLLGYVGNNYSIIKTK